ncbi:DUF1080 domain-containing protein [candidate division KSB1 bacterium]|nr:DUF1080 domain-containing protein [candidate division KSB1 bacterium]
MRRKPILLQWSLLLLGGIFVTHCAQDDQGPDPKATEVWQPEPVVVIPGKLTAPPSDAIILFDGKDFSHWQHKDGEPVKWELKDGAMTVVDETGSIYTRQGFGDCQLHVEWRTPANISGNGQGRGNSGIFLQNRYELQVLDSYENRTYSNGQAGSIYKQYIPLVNACRKPGEWQTFDIIYTAPRFDAGGKVVSPAVMTVLHNGVLIQNHSELRGSTVYKGEPEYKPHSDREPLMLQDHGDPVSYRNIWIREL